jgi:RNA polymerase sigma-70 factor (ECF subfamily)
VGVSLDELFRRYAVEVLAYALRRTDRASAEDVVSEVFLIAGRRLERVPVDDAGLWLYGVARRVLANQRRGGRRRAALASSLSDLARGRAHTHAAAVGGSPLLEALAALRPNDRELLLLTAWEGLDAAAVAVVLGCSPHAVHTRLYRARARLHAELVRRGHAPRSLTSSEAAP